MHPSESVNEHIVEEKSQKESYREPTLEKREKLIDVTEALASPAPVST